MHVSVHHCGTHKLDFIHKNFTFVNMSFGDLVRKAFNAEGTERLYFRSVGIHQDPSDMAKSFPHIAQDFQIPECMRSIINGKCVSCCTHWAVCSGWGQEGRAV